MKLYTHIERINNELKELGKADSDALNAREISGFDQLHYHGTLAVDHAIEMMAIDESTRVLEIGSGFGGPARHLAATGCHVTALELQPDQNQLAAELTERCGLGQRISHICGDFLTHPWGDQRFDAIASWLAVFHIPDRARTLSISANLLPPGGLYFAEDMYCRSPMAKEEFDELASGMYAAYLPDMATFQADFTDAGFDILQCDEMSDDWTQFTSERLAGYRSQRERHIRVHDESTYLAMEEFYDLVNRHFRSGKLGGVRILARRT